MQYQLAVSILAGLTLVSAAPNADALPWAKANPQAKAAANAYADAFAEAVAIGHADPDAYALAASADDCASISCHASCGLLIIEGQACSSNSENSYSGPYDTSCLCSEGSSFLQYYDPCMTCGWTLWKYYGVYVSSALEACGTLSTEPTGTLRCSTTLTDSYTPDFSIEGCTYLGNCDESSTADASTTEASTTSAAASTTSAAETSSAQATSTSTSAQETSTSAQETSTSETSTAQAASTQVESSTAETTEATTEASSTAAAAAASTTEATSSESASVEQVSSTEASSSSTVSVATFEGSAAKVGISTALIAVVFSFLF